MHTSNTKGKKALKKTERDRNERTGWSVGDNLANVRAHMSVRPGNQGCF